jgi:hypothetical protein
MTVDYEGDPYVLLVPIDELQDVDEDEVVILKIEAARTATTPMWASRTRSCSKRF